MRRYLTVVIGVLLAATLIIGDAAQAQTRGPLYIADIDGVVTSVSVGYLRRALGQAEAADAGALVIVLRSQGAVLQAIRPFASELERAKVPVVVYVAPDTQAGAAGAFLLSAAHIAAMAPNSSFGSATPLAHVDELLSEQTRNLVLDSVAQQLRDWNAQRGRSVDWVDRAVREGAIVNNEQASATTPPAVDLVASDVPELLTLLEGRVVTLEGGRQVQLATVGRTPQPIAPTIWEQIRLLLASPTVAFMLLVLAGIAFYTELAHPGASVFAGAGVVLLVASFLGIAALPIRWPSLLAILVAFGLVGADLFVPSHGGLTVAGLALLVVGALTLIDQDQAPGVFVAVWLVLVVALALASFAALGLWFALRSRNQPVSAGSEALVGKLAEVRQRLGPEGMVFVEGALWRAVSENGEVEPGEWVQVTAVHDLRLLVRRAE